MISLRHSTVLALAGLLMMAACAKDPTGPDDLSDEFAAAMESGGNMPSEVVNSETILEEDPPTTDDLGGGTYITCTRQRVSAMKGAGGSGGFPLFDPGAGVIYPGSLLRGASLKNAPPDPIAVQRAGGVVSINIINGSQGVYREVEEVTQAKIVQAMNDIITDNSGLLPANFSLSVHDARSREQLALGLGVDISSAFVSVEANFSMRTDKQYSRFLVKLTQSYYTMSFQLPTSYESLFAPEVTPENLSQYVSSGNPATYISDVTYGRIYYMLVESEASQLELGASIEASFNKGLVEGTITADMDYLRQTSSLNISVFALGGEAGTLIRTFGVTDLDSLRELFASSSDIRTGVPLSYVVRNVVDNRIVAMQLGTEYDVVNCNTYSDMFLSPAFTFDPADQNISADQFTLASGEQVEYVAGWTETVSNTPALFDDTQVIFDKLTNCVAGVETEKVKGIYAGRLYRNGVNNHNYISFLQHRTPALDTTVHSFAAADSAIHVYTHFRFNGRMLESSSFTIFAVVRSTADDNRMESSGGQYFLFSNDRENFHSTRQTLIFGWSWPGNSEGFFRGYGGAQQPVPNRKNWTVYAFRFSTLEGMTVYIDNVNNKNNVDHLKEALLGFRGASIGLLQQRQVTNIVSAGLNENPCWEYGFTGPQRAGIDIAHVEAYTVAGGEEQIEERMQQLAEKFGIF